MDLKIIDSGWLSSKRTGVQQADADRLNSGNAITLKAPSLSLRNKALLNSDAIPGSFADAPVNNNGYVNDVISIVLIVDKSTSSEYDLLADLNKMCKTKGVKLLYPSSLTDTEKSIVELLGSTSTNFNGNEVGASTPVLMGYAESVAINDDSSSSKFRVTIPFRVTG